MTEIRDADKTRFVTGAMSDTNRMLKGQKVSCASFEAMFRAGIVGLDHA